jgi:hypothetical protein
MFRVWDKKKESVISQKKIRVCNLVFVHDMIIGSLFLLFFFSEREYNLYKSGYTEIQLKSSAKKNTKKYDYKRKKKVKSSSLNAFGVSHKQMKAQLKPKVRCRNLYIYIMLLLFFCLFVKKDC